MENTEAAEKREKEGCPQFSNQLVLYWEQTFGQGPDFYENNSLETVETLTKKRDQLKREIKGLKKNHQISWQYIPFEVLYNVLREQQKEIEKKTNEYHRLTFQIAQKMNVSGDNLKPQA